MCRERELTTICAISAKLTVGFTPVERGHPLSKFLGKEPFSRLVRFPHIKVDRAPLLLVEGEELEPQPDMPSNMPRAFWATCSTRKRSKSPYTAT
jgi:hypothetical protein